MEFDTVHFYGFREIGIPVEVKLEYGGLTEEFTAKIDTGSTFCIFRRLHGAVLGIDIEDGIYAKIGTATNNFDAYGHEVTLTVLGIETVSTVYFAESEYFDRNVLGRIGWLDRVKLGFIEQEGKLYLSKYEK